MSRVNYTYFAISFSKPIVHYGYEDKQKPAYNGFWRRFKVNENFPEIGGRKIISYFDFDQSDDSTLEIKVAISGVSTSGALKNLAAEASGKSFDELAYQAREKWNKELSVIVQKAIRINFPCFTLPFHTLINPSVYADVDGQYRGVDQNIHPAGDFVNYTVFSVWDTYRALHPLFNIINRQIRIW